MNRKQAEKRHPIVKTIRELSERFDVERHGVIKDFNWLSSADEAAKKRLCGIAGAWFAKCREFKKSGICGVAINVPPDEILTLCGIAEGN